MKKTNLKLKLSGLRRRTQKSGNVFYYLELSKSPGRSEIPLGTDFNKALIFRAKYLLKFDQINTIQNENFSFISELFSQILLPTKPLKIQSENLSAIVNLRKFVNENNLRYEPNFRHLHENDYIAWRGSKAQIRARREWSLISVIDKWFQAFIIEQNSINMD